MFESPILQELKAEWTQEGARDATQRSIIRVLTARFGRADPDIADRLKMVSDEARLEALTDAAVLCPDLEAFRDRLDSGS